MPILTKPCKGKLSNETLELLRTSRSRPDWGVYTCEVCGQSVGVTEEKGEWVPERHWPSVVYTPRKRSVGRYQEKTVFPSRLRLRPQ